MSAATYRSLCKLVATLCKKYGLTEKKVLRHYDKNNVSCPLFLVSEENWEQFKADVKATRQGKDIEVTNAPIKNVVPTGETPDSLGESGDG